MSLSDKIEIEKGTGVNLIHVKNIREAVKELKINEKKLYEGWSHFCKCINFGDSALDADAIVFMNEFRDILKIDETFGEKLT